MPGKASIWCALWVLWPRPSVAHHGLPRGRVSPEGALGGLGQLFGTGGGGVGLAWPSGAPQTNAHGPWSTRERAFVRRLWGGAAIYSKENTYMYPYARVRYSATRAYAFGASDYVRRSCGALSAPALRSGLARL